MNTNIGCGDLFPTNPPGYFCPFCDTNSVPVLLSQTTNVSSGGEAVQQVWQITDRCGNSASCTSVVTIGFPSSYVDPGGVLPGFSAALLPTSFDNASVQVSLPSLINFCGGWYSSIWINEDGNATLDGSFGGHVPPNYVPALALTNLNRVILAPFWADLDTTTKGSGSVAWGTNCAYVNGQTLVAFGVTWSNVGYYRGHRDKTNSFQMLIIYLRNGDFDLQYRYGGIQWDTADSAGGLGGLSVVLGGVQNSFPARVGFAGTNNCGFELLPGSGVANAFLDAGPNSLTANSNGGVYTWRFTNGWIQ